MLQQSALAALATLVIAAALAPSTASANVGEVFGFGARSEALGGADIAGGFDGFASYANPGALPFDGDKRMLLSWGLIYVSPNFTPISNVTIENNLNGDTPTTGNVDVNYLPTFGQSLGMTYRLFPDMWNFTFGLSVFLPVSQIAYMDTGEMYEPEYFMYRSRTQRPQIDAGMGVDLGKGFQLGVGLHLGYSLTSNATIFLDTGTNNSSSMRFIASLVPRAAPYVGLYVRPGMSDKISLGTVFRLAVASPNSMNLSASAKILGNLASIAFTFPADSVLFYDPMALEIGGTWKMSERFKTYAQLDYEFWSSYQTPAISITNPQTTNCSGGGCGGGIVLDPTIAPTYTFQNLLVPRLGEEISLSDVTAVRLGYSFHGSILATPDPTNGNFIDPPRHSFNVGVGWKFKHFLAFDTPSTLDLYMTYAVLVAGTVTKTQSDGAGDTSSQVIGGPGYATGGNMVGGGASITLPF